MRLGIIVNDILRPFGYFLGKLATAAEGNRPWDNIDFGALGLSVEEVDIPFTDNRSVTGGHVSIIAEDLDKIFDPKTHARKRVLEIGPKGGEHSRWIDRELNPSKFVMVELPRTAAEFDARVGLLCSHELIIEDILLSSRIDREGPFDLIFCTGVLYHTVEQFKLLHRLWNLTAHGGMMLLQTTALKRPGSFLDLRWHQARVGNYCLPSVEAVFTMLAMTGWNHISWFSGYRPDAEAVVMLCEKADQVPLSYTGSPFGSSNGHKHLQKEGEGEWRLES